MQRKDTLLTPHNSLVRYIDTYRDPRADLEGHEEEGMVREKSPWWAFWRSSKGGATVPLSGFVTPEDWLSTQIRTGLDDLEIERRRRYTGWNELTSEKENMFVKFIGFFMGPILYGKCRRPDPQALV